MASRQGHYMPPSLLQSQLQALEVPEADEAALGLPIGPAPAELAAVAAAWLRARPAARALPSAGG
jgi:gluconokinase